MNMSGGPCPAQEKCSFYENFLDKNLPSNYKQLLLLSGNNSVVECDLAKVEVAGSNPVSRSTLINNWAA